MQKLFLHTGCASASLLGSKHCRALGWHSWVSFSLWLAQHRAPIALIPLPAPPQPRSKQLQSPTNCSQLAPPIDVPKCEGEEPSTASQQSPLITKPITFQSAPSFFSLQQEIPLIPLCCSGHCPPALSCKNCKVQASALQCTSGSCSFKATNTHGQAGLKSSIQPRVFPNLTADILQHL